MRYYFKTKPMRHQTKALKKFLKAGCGALFAEMGTGKTKIAIDWACALATKENRPMRAVVLCPKSVLTVWPDELIKHDPYHELGPTTGVEWKFYSVDSAWRPFYYDEIVLWEPDIIIVDESDVIKSVGARRSKGAYLISRYCKYRLIMSGTPIGKNYLDLFPQYKVVDDSIFGTNIGDFKSRYMLFRAHKVVKYLHTKQMKRKMRPVTFSVTKDQCLDLPPRRGHAWDPDGVKIVRIPLSNKTREVYDELARESIVEFEGMEVMTPIVLTRILRLMMLSSGWLSQSGQHKRVGQEKKMQLVNDLDEMRIDKIDKVVIFVRFRHELKDAALAAKQAGYHPLLFFGAVSLKKRARKIKAFHNTDKPVVFIAQWQTGARGIDLSCAHECIIYGLTESLIQYSQGIDRLHRLGQVNKVQYRHYVAEHTVEETVIGGLIEKKSISDDVIQSPELMYGREQLTAKQARKARKRNEAAQDT